MKVQVGDRVRLKEATVKRFDKDGAVIVVDGAGSGLNYIQHSQIAEVLPRPFQVGDLVRQKGDKTYPIWEIVYISDQITLGKVKSASSKVFKIGQEAVINTEHKERVS